MKLRNILTTSSLILISSGVNAQIKTVFMCKACPAGTYSNGKQESCTPCDYGEYQENIASSSCNPCPAGKYQDTKGQASCKTCETGTWAPEKSKNCTNCLLTGVAACDSKTGKATSCKSGYGLTSDGYCQRCAAGYYSEGGTMACTICPAGKYSGAEASSCTLCPAGSYSSSAGSSSCTECKSPYYQPNKGQTSCPYECDTTTPSCSYTYKCGETCQLCPEVGEGASECKPNCTPNTCSGTNYGTPNKWTKSSCTGRTNPSCPSSYTPSGSTDIEFFVPTGVFDPVTPGVPSIWDLTNPKPDDPFGVF